MSNDQRTPNPLTQPRDRAFVVLGYSLAIIGTLVYTFEVIRDSLFPFVDVDRHRTRE